MVFEQRSLIDNVDKFFQCAGISNAYRKYAGYFSLNDIFTVDSVYVCGMRAAANAKYKKDTLYFLDDPWGQSARICDGVLNGSFKPRYYKQVTIDERGKIRVINPPHFDNKVVQKVLNDYVVRPVLMGDMIETSYAGVPGRGCEMMWGLLLDDLNDAVESGMDFRIVITDYSGFFDSIPNDMLAERMGALIVGSGVMDSIRLFFTGERGLSIGNEMSQIPASWYPTPVDRVVVDVFGFKYHRYMDDTCAIVPADCVDEYIDVFKRESSALGLSVPNRKIKIYEPKNFFSFCKEQYRWDKRRKCYYRLPNPKKFSREKNKLLALRRKLDDGEIGYDNVIMQFNGVIGGLVSHPNTVQKCRELTGVFESVFPELVSFV